MESFCCLGIEAATERASIAACCGGRVAVRELTDGEIASRAVYRAVSEVLDRLALPTEQLGCIAYGAGPGSFTGVRIAAAVAQALGYALAIPVVPVSTLAVIAAEALGQAGCERVLVGLDARRSQLYVGDYVPDAAEVVRSVGGDQLLAPDAIRPPPGRFLAVGPGWQVYPEAVGRLGAACTGVDAERLPSAEVLLRLAAARFCSGAVVAATQALPNYVGDDVGVRAAPGDKEETN